MGKFTTKLNDNIKLIIGIITLLGIVFTGYNLFAKQSDLDSFIAMAKPVAASLAVEATVAGKNFLLDQLVSKCTSFAASKRPKAKNGAKNGAKSKPTQSVGRKNGGPTRKLPPIPACPLKRGHLTGYFH